MKAQSGMARASFLGDQGSEAADLPKTETEYFLSVLLFCIYLKYIRMSWLFSWLREIYTHPETRGYMTIFIYLDCDVFFCWSCFSVGSVRYEALYFWVFLWLEKSLEDEHFLKISFTTEQWLLIVWQETNMFTGRKQISPDFSELFPYVFLQCLIIL